MPNQRDTLPIIRTKLYRPAIPADQIKRGNLIRFLEQHETYPLMMVVAPAGYGKSTLASSWIRESGKNAAWFSIENSDNNLTVFLSYLIAAVRETHPECFKRLSALIRNKELPPVSELAWELNSELDQIPESLTLVFDDYHRISNSDIHKILEFQLRHPPEHIQFMLLCRRDPPLPLGSLQAKNLMCELRLNDLMFSLDDSEEFLGNIEGLNLSKGQIRDLHESMEGWAVGLRLMTLALQSSSDKDKLIGNIPDGHPRIQRYLMEEVLSDLDPVHRECISRISLLDRYCEPLNRALCSNACNSCSRELQCMFSPGDDGRKMAWNPLSIPLDGEGEWFRYHHQFQNLLKEYLHQHLSADEIEQTYVQAVEWLEANDYVDEAVQYAMKVSSKMAIDIISRHRHTLMNTECWVQLRYWIERFDQEIIDGSPDLLLLQAWCNVGYPEMFEMLNRAGELLAAVSPDSGQTRLQGELLAYRSLGYYAQMDSAGTVKCATEALELLDEDQLCERGFAHILYALGLQMDGRWEDACSDIRKTIGQRTYVDTTYHTRLLATLCFGVWNDADALQLKPYATEYLALGRKLRFSETIDHGLYFQGLVYYDLNELDKAQHYLEELVSNPAISNQHNYLHAAYVLALTYVAQDKPEEAAALTEKVVSISLKSQQASIMEQSIAFEAEMALRSGRLAEAEKWLSSFKPENFRPIMWRFYVPHFTRIRILLARKNPEFVQKALESARALCSYTAEVHNIHFTIIALIQHALALNALGKVDEALSVMGDAVEAALPGGGIRSFLDEGTDVAVLLNQLELDSEALRFVGRILAAFRDAPEDESNHSSLNLQAGLLDPLSTREREVLLMLAGPLENKAIAEKLFISPGTVKRHTNSIYSKLAVHSRRAAVDKARGLGLLSS